MQGSSETRGFRPDRTIQGELRPPGSKSIAQRALLLAAVARGRTVLGGLPDGEDVRACLELVRDLGATVEPMGEGCVAIGGTGGLPRPVPVLRVGESGTLARLATGLVALCADVEGPVEIGARGSLLARSSPALFRSLFASGVQLRFTAGEDGWPVGVEPARPREALVLEQPGSSQELSALLVASAALDASPEVRVRGPVPSRPYVGITLDVLRRFGVEVETEGDPEDETWRVRGRLQAPGAPFLVEPDASSAAVALAAGCLSGGAVRVHGVGERSSQGDVRIVEHLRAFGCEAFAEPAGLVARGRPARGAQLRLGGEPDLAPVLAVVGAAAAQAGGGASQLFELDTLRGKESDRLAVLENGLKRVGFQARASRQGVLMIGPAQASPPRKPIVLDPAGDHRMAFAFALLGLVVDGVQVLDPGCVAKSWPGFWDDLTRLGASSSHDSDVGR